MHEDNSSGAIRIKTWQRQIIPENVITFNVRIMNQRRKNNN